MLKPSLRVLSNVVPKRFNAPAPAIQISAQQHNSSLKQTTTSPPPQSTTQQSTLSQVTTSPQTTTPTNKDIPEDIYRIAADIVPNTNLNQHSQKNLQNLQPNSHQNSQQNFQRQPQQNFQRQSQQYSQNQQQNQHQPNYKSKILQQKEKHQNIQQHYKSERTTNNNQTTHHLLDASDNQNEPEQPKYPILSPEQPFTPREKITSQNASYELTHYLNTGNLQGVRAVQKVLRTHHIPLHVIAYNRLLTFYTQKRDHAAVTQVLEDMAQERVAQDTFTHLILLNHANNRENQSDFDQVLAKLQATQLSREHALTVFNVRLKNAVKRANRKEAITAILEEMRKGGFAPDEFTYHTILCYHATNKDLEKSLRVLDEMRAANVPIREAVFDVILSTCTNDKQVQEVQRIMKKMGHQLSLKTYNMRISAAAKNGDLAQCRELLRAMEQHGVQPDVASYNGIIKGLAQRQQMKECNELVAEMIKKEVFPDAATYSILATGWASNGLFSQAVELLTLMRTKNLPIKYAVTSVIYHMILAGRIEQGLGLFKQLVIEGTAEVETYNSVLCSLLEARAMQACDQVYALMRERGVLPDHVTYQALILLADRNGQDVHALRDNMRTDGVEPDEKMLNTLLNYSKGPASRELALIKEMRAKGYKVNPGLVLKAMKSGAYTGDHETCAQLIADMRTHDVDAITSQMYHLLVVAYINVDNHDGVWKTVAEMKQLKLGPTDQTFQVLLDFLHKHKNWEKCVELLEEMEANHVYPVGLWQ